ncbi:MAG: RsmE family RNA methyltransferase [Kiritimatiellae bacterium]|nr:RsmE family RNA methyltransferase [Kiritimatiellia bacterium]MDD4737282.1 RsmE family RNA methyltransferase [Kiritimatiellia bacterium]
MNRIILEPKELEADGCEVLLTDARAAHLRRVLNVVPGQTVRVGLLDGPLGVGEVVRIEAEGVLLRCRWEPVVPEVPRVDLLLALPRPKVLKRLWAQLAALGVGRVYITNAERVERNYFDTHVLKESFIRGRLIEGLQQCGDTRLPRVSVHRRLKVLLEGDWSAEKEGCERLVAHPAGGVCLSEYIPLRHPERALLAVGPEGGWTEYELALFEKHGFASVSAGERILRSDTACLALLAILHEWMNFSTKIA